MISIDQQVTAETYTVDDYNLDLMVIKIREDRGRPWVSCVTSHVPSRSGGDEHHVKIYRKNPPKCTCKANEFGRLCWAMKLIALISSDNKFFKN